MEMLNLMTLRYEVQITIDLDAEKIHFPFPCAHPSRIDFYFSEVLWQK